MRKSAPHFLTHLIVSFGVGGQNLNLNSNEKTFTTLGRAPFRAKWYLLGSATKNDRKLL